MKLLKLSNSFFKFSIDDEDFNRVSLYGWCLGGENLNRIYATIDGRTSHLGRFILNYDVPLEVDHRNHNILNNQKENLRLATKQQNTANQRVREFTFSGYKGVTRGEKYGKKWRANIYKDKIKKNLGSYDTKEEAALAYNKAAIELFGEFACLNRV